MEFNQWSGSAKSGCWRRRILALALLGALLATPVAAGAEHKNASVTASYNPADAGHPVRILYYIVYPVGFLLDNLILKPAWWLGQRQPFRSIFGVDSTGANL